MINKPMIWLMGCMACGLMGFGKAPQAAPAGAKLAARSELEMLAEQYQAGADRARDRASERDRLAIQAQSAIIGLKDAELQMERSISAGREICGKSGKVLNMTAAVWACGAPPAASPERKDVDKK